MCSVTAYASSFSFSLCVSRLSGRPQAPVAPHRRLGAVQSAGRAIDEAQKFTRRPPSLPVPAGTDARYAKMPVVSEKYSQERAARAQAVLDRLKQRDGDAHDRRAARRLHRQGSARASLRRREFRPTSAVSDDGFLLEFANELISAPSIRCGLRHYIARLQSFKEYTTAHIAMLRLGLASGNTLLAPRVADLRADACVSMSWSLRRKSVLRATAEDPATFPHRSERIQRDGTAAVRDSVRPRIVSSSRS